MADTRQKALIVRTAADGTTAGLESLNASLRHGWRVVDTTPMGGAGRESAPQWAALVILEQRGEGRPEHPPVMAEEPLPEEAEEVVEEVVEGPEGDGAPL
ncbi:hypothetical protein [Salisaeta longa]|uniref:hypothetical protein n=1 Tax=Salisaeta longa TaxID=503170 RepID=UPI0003B4F841|nr:hypothetical protein [Salisaeta longa]